MHIQDELQRTIELQQPITRIVSLCPAVTETLFALGVGHYVVGRTKFCIFPAEAASVPAVGGTKDVNYEAIDALAPQLILCEKEENTKDIVETLAKTYPVYVAQVETIAMALTMIEKLGLLTNSTDAANSLIANINAVQLPTLTGRAAYMMWRKPYMVVGATTYINDVLETIGFTNPFTAHDGRYPAVTIEQLQDAQLDYLLLSSEPFPFAQKHIDELQPHLPNTRIQLIDGEMFWYGAKMKEAAPYLQNYFVK
ncbi:ABC transporter substrate-binding protein [Caryophanon latum]|uniref:Iron ABC transporter substrate-binding protein n=1 Tax=Caryophanon latum TaxID=33977 RepID=A0A1C0YPI6_9BACL|nr:helical backbone metal receptor [Caryophanon latum]OCS89073.1 iron ABC transporter substrate-binding protein [Caryophanon latum]